MNRKALRRFWSRLNGLLPSRRRDQDLADELESHIELLTEDNIRGGMSPADARRAALLKLGGLESVKESYRDQRGLPAVESLFQDLRYAFRGMRRRPGFTITAVTCLALGIGATTALFSVLNAVLIRRLPVAQPEQLVQLRFQGDAKLPKTVRRSTSGFNRSSFPHYMLQELQDGDSGISELFAFVPLNFDRHGVTVNIDGTPSTAGGEMVSANYFRGLGVAPVIGRAIAEEDLKPGSPNVAVLSYGYWTRQFGRDRSIIGHRISLNGQPFVIIGVAPQEFFGVNAALPPDFWVPLRDVPGLAPWGNSSPKAGAMFSDRAWWWCMLMGRLKPGVTAQRAQLQLDTRFRQLLAAAAPADFKPEILPHVELTDAGKGLDNLRNRLSQPLKLLLAATGLVLLIACANVATLLLARATARQRETSVRLALGAMRGRLIRQYVTESVLLALVGGGLGVLVAYWGSHGLVLLDQDTRGLSLDVQPDGTVLGFCLGLSLLTGILFGLAPAFRATRTNVSTRIQEGVTMHISRLSLGSALVAGQVALSVLLLFGAGLFLRTLGNLESQDLGFRRENLLVFALNPPRTAYTGDRRVEFYHRALEAIQPLPGVESATSSGLALLSGWTNNSDASTDSAAQPTSGKASNTVSWNTVGPNFFHTMGMNLIQGRDLDWTDIRLARKVAVVNAALARQMFPNRNPVGHRFSMSEEYNPSEAIEIIGVVGDAKYASLRGKAEPTAYISYTAIPESVSKMHYEVRTAADPAAVLTAIRTAMRGIDPAVPLVDPKTQTEMLREGLGEERLFAVLCTVFGSLAMILVAVGLYGTLAYTVTRRTNEIGIRMALGAPRTHVLWMVLRESLLLIGAGALVGLPAALMASRLVENQVYGVKPGDPVTLAAALSVLLLVGATASFLPARRAAQIDPQVALRNE
ncbi:MAG: ABC transporter permease [Acidobacteria bacterium]|nr:ABC transporter permease [Acidobacteriota bacterium]